MLGSQKYSKGPPFGGPFFWIRHSFRTLPTDGPDASASTRSTRRGVLASQFGYASFFVAAVVPLFSTALANARRMR